MRYTAARIIAHDRRRTAMHEAAHALIASYLGYRAEAWIYRNEIEDLLASKAWLGHMSFYDIPDEPGHLHRRMVAVAGMVAEHLWENRAYCDYTDTGFWIDVMLDRDCMSPADWRLANCEPGEPDHDLPEVMVHVADLLAGDLWPSLTRMSRILMSDTESIHSFQPASAAQALAA